MSDTVDLFKRASSGFEQRLTAAPAEKLDAQSPCTDWKARDVVTHVIGGLRMLKAALDGGSTEEVGKAMESKIGNDLVAEWKAASSGAVGAINADSLSKTANLPFGAMPGQMAVGIFTNDVLIHTWDLARATGGDEKLDEEALRAGYEAMKPMDAMIRQPGVFGPKIESPKGADLQTEALNFFGREV